MKIRIFFCVSSVLAATACQVHGQRSALQFNQSETDLVTCIRTVMTLDAGRWEYMGTIAQLGGTFRTYAATSIHKQVGPDQWSTKSFDGDVGVSEEDAETGIVQLVGNTLVPLRDGQLFENEGTRYFSCDGPDSEGRYETELEYYLPNEDGTRDFAKNTTWFSEHGSYYHEDHFNAEGRVVSRRSGVKTPAK